jgi:DNA invertase Pin-like site-specific DNA recombinase
MGKIYKYLRVSTDKQDIQQQDNTINAWMKAKGLVADEVITDEGVSGTVSFKNRNLNNIVGMLDYGDCLVISEISRLTRGGISELYSMISKYFKPHGLRLVICNAGLDIDCSDMDAMTELQLSMMATFAKMERDLIRSRTKSALEVRKKQIEENGGFTSKKGIWRTKLGCPKDSINNNGEGGIASGESKARKISADHDREMIYKTSLSLKANGLSAAKIAESLNGLGYRTPRGCEFNVATVNMVFNKWGKYFEA